MLYRGFSYVHARLLLDLQTGISILERELDDFDNEDDTEDQRLRLQCWEEDIEAAREMVSETGTRRRTRRDVLEELHEQVSKYVSNGQLGMRTLSIKEGSRASIYTPDR